MTTNRINGCVITGPGFPSCDKIIYFSGINYQLIMFLCDCPICSTHNLTLSVPKIPVELEK